MQNALIGKTDESGVAGTNTAKIDHDVITYHAAYLPELDVWPGGVEEVPGTGGGAGGGGGGGDAAHVKVSFHAGTLSNLPFFLSFRLPFFFSSTKNKVDRPS